MRKQPVKPRSRGQPARAPFQPRGFSFKREAKWMTAMNLAPFGIGFVLALVFWFTR
ncbi:MAG TPA: hypothetical protein VFU83_09045 [Pyrinomonadaceae bacterium]|nr:hypothetical protein [Pyrinomonadaceae bacterium]